MDSRNEDVKGDWTKEKLLGSGGFGMVVLWRNNESKEAIALKQCRWGHDHNLMTQRHRSRWELEINIMKRLSHLNVVTAISVPEVLDVKGNELPLLAMEYCSGGDLRRLLNMPENCCGIVESEARTLIHDVSAAIKYLHSERIVHRDLKPENIVLQDVNNQMRYKLIDLGYAKDLDEGSVCTSFVGTLQYLAPELFMNKNYTSSVDYWSFGLVAVECITGLRPFLHNLSPAKWMPYVRQKSPEDICAYVGADGNVIFSKEIFSHNQVSRVFKRYIEKWLTLMLEWSPKKRGKGTEDSIQSFKQLEMLLNKKVIHMFIVHIGQTYSYEVPSDMTVTNLQIGLANETGLKEDEQHILSARGSLVPSDKLVAEYCHKPEDSMLFVLKKSMNKCGEPEIKNELPELVEKMLRDPSAKVKYDEQRRIWSHVLLYVKKQCELFKKFLQAHRVFMTSLITNNSVMNKTTNALMSGVIKMLAKQEFFVESLKKDVEMYEAQTKNDGVCSRMMYDSWNATMDFSLKITALSDEAHKLECNAGMLNTQTVELQRSPFFRPKASENLDNLYQSIVEQYDKLRKLPREKRNEMFDSQEIAKTLMRFLKMHDKTTKDLFANILKLNNCRNDISRIIQPMQECLKSIESFCAQLISLQLKRQKDLWNIIKILVSKPQTVNGAPVSFEQSLHLNESSGIKQQNIPPSMEVDDCPDISSMSLSELVSYSSNESMRIMSDNQSLRHRMADMSESLWQKHNEIMAEKNSMDFSFLSSDDILK